MGFCGLTGCPSYFGLPGGSNSLYMKLYRCHGGAYVSYDMWVA